MSLSSEKKTAALLSKIPVSTTGIDIEWLYDGSSTGAKIWKDGELIVNHIPSDADWGYSWTPEEIMHELLVKLGYTVRQDYFDISDGGYTDEQVLEFS